MELQPGMVVGGHARLLKLLGQGGMGSVWLAQHLRLDTEVAVKVLASPEYRKIPKLVERFQREAKAAAQVNDPHIVRILDHGLMPNGSPFIIMERLHGESLRDRLLRTGVVDLTIAAQILEQTAQALRAAHRQQIVHRDIKPDNIFLCGDDNAPFVKVLDFGIAIKTGFNAEQKRLTTTAQLVGTPAYMSPEQILSPKRPGPEADMWALAVTGYEMVVGDIPFDGPTIGAMMMAISTGRYPAPSERRPALPAAFDDWCARAFSQQTRACFTTPQELAEAFRACCEQAGPLTAQRISVEPAAPRSPQGLPASDVPTLVPATQVMRPAYQAEAPTPKLAVAHSPTTPIRSDELATFDGASTPVRKRALQTRRSRMILGAAAALMLVGLAAGAALLIDKEPAVSLATPAPMTPLASAISSGAAHTLEQQGGGIPEGMLRVPAGRYTVGCSGGRSAGCFPDEGPIHQVDLKAFALMKHEVSSADYQRCVRVGACDAPASRDSCQSQPQQPVRCVRWRDADRYCRYRGWRLPSEQEWEAAARGSAASRYSWGQARPSCERTIMRGANGLGCGSGGPKAVGSSSADRSWMGALDMGGNVREWTASSYQAYPGGNVRKRAGRRVNRGGSYEMTAAEMSSSWTRNNDKASTARPDLGFRCVADITP